MLNGKMTLQHKNRAFQHNFVVYRKMICYRGSINNRRIISIKTKRTLAGMLVAVLLFVSMPASAVSSNLTPHYGNGYYPSGVQTSAKYFEYFLGGPRTSALAQLPYGTENRALKIEIIGLRYYNPYSGWDTITTEQYGYGTNSYNYTFSASELAAGAYVSEIEAKFKIGTTQVAWVHTS